MKDFAEVLRELLDINEFSVTDLSTLSGISERVIENYLKGRILPTEETKNIFFNILGKPNEVLENERISIEEVARILQVSEQAVRIGLQRGIYKFGEAIKSKSKYSYVIPKSKFMAYLQAN